MNNTPHISHCDIRRRIAAAAAVAAVFATAIGQPQQAASASGVNDSYCWPVKPFDRAHPVRGNFGDPRTTFKGSARLNVLMSGAGIFAFHFGIDISVPDGTAVYPVRSGIVTVRGEVVHVDSGDGFVAEYWHLVPTVASGSRVVARETVLGHVRKGYEHVHFSEFDNGVAVNPLATGHLTPYSDRTKPTVTAISFRTPSMTAEVIPESVSGRIVILAQAEDKPQLRVPGIWGDLPVAPALLTWRVVRVTDGRLAIPRQVAFDFRRTLPSNSMFWGIYGRGSRQNMTPFAGGRAWRAPGVYRYRLTAQAFDTTRLPNGIYRLVVTATDIRGNSASNEQVFIVQNGAAV